MKLIVKYDSLLLDYLYENITNNSKNNIKTFLKNGIYVNDIKTTKYNYLLKKGDKITIAEKVIDKDFNKINVIYEDDDLIVVDKPYGILTVATQKEKEKTLYHLVLEYLKKKKQKVFIVHRLDKETSGIVVFAKNEKIKLLLQNNWEKMVKVREYIAIVDGIIKEDGIFKSYLFENKNHLVYSTNKGKGKLAITKYRKIKCSKKYTLVDIEIETGRKNQIRVQFADAGHSIIGDKKYGTKKGGRMYLHANKLCIIRPITNKQMIFESVVPEEFNKLMEG